MFTCLHKIGTKPLQAVDSGARAREHIHRRLSSTSFFNVGRSLITNNSYVKHDFMTTS